MSDWDPEIRARLAALQLHPAREAAIVEELANHLDDCHAALLGQGLSPAAARAAALAELAESGQLARALRPVIREPYREPPRGNAMLPTASEVRNATRGLLRSPTVALSAVFCLALGIGATTAISSAMSRALLQPLPFRDAERLVAVHRITPQSGPLGTWPQSTPNYVDLARDARQIEGLSAITWGTALINLPAEAIQASQIYVSAGLFQTLGARAQLGRFLLPDDDRLDAPLVGVLSDALWRTRFGADPTIVGRTLTIDGEATTIVGIAPREFRIPHGSQMVSAELWSPLRLDPANLGHRRANRLLMLGRLTEDATVQSAEAEMKGLFANLVASYPDLKGEDVRVAPLHSENVRSVRKPLLLLFAAVCLVLFIAAANVAAMLLARGVQRRREMAVRTALGGSRWDILRPMLLESVLLTGVSVVVGIALAAAGLKTIGTLATARMPQLAGLHLDWRVLAFALGLSVVVALACGAVPALRSARVDPQDALRGGRGGGSGREHHRALRGLVVVEIALSLMLLIGAGLVLKTFASLLGKDPGFDTAHTLTLRITTSALRYPNQTAVRGFVMPAVDAIEAIPAVAAASPISALPYVQWGNNSNIRYEGMPREEPTRLPRVEQRSVLPSFFAVTRQRLIAGRLLTDGDNETPESPAVVVVNEALVKRDFPGRTAVGQRYHIDDTTFATIVGVVSDIRNMGPIRDPEPEMYYSYLQTARGAATVPLMVRVTDGDPTGVVPAIRAAVRKIDASAAVADVAAMDDLIARSLGSPRFYFILLGTFAVVAIALAVAGLYGVLSYAIEQRTREIGIRTALGSSRTRIIRLFMMEGARLVALGIIIGLIGGMAATRLMAFMLYDTSPLDPVAWTAAAALMGLAALAAAIVPAFRAARVDPLVAIQAD